MTLEALNDNIEGYRKAKKTVLKEIVENSFQILQK